MGHAQSPIDNLNGQTAIEKMKALAEAAGTCFFTTKVGKDSNSRPMALQQVDDHGALWFLSSIDSQKNADIAHDSYIELYFLNNSKYEYLFIKGDASISQDAALKEEHWTPFAQAWFEGKDDPKLSVIKVTPIDGYYYETKDNKIVAMSKMLFAAITGKQTEDGGVEGSLNL